MFKNLNLKDNLREDQHFTILNEAIWSLLVKVYGGREILRFGGVDENGREHIEVNLIKIYTYFFPRPDTEQYLRILYVSKSDTLEHIMTRMEEYKGRKRNVIRFWKAGIPKNMKDYYRDLLCEWKKYQKIKYHGTRLDADLDKSVEDCALSRDDMLVIEVKADGGFILNPIEEVQAENHLKLSGDDIPEEWLSNPESMDFLKIPIEKALKNNSSQGLCGLSNLGNTCFMNSALQCISNTTELTKYLLFGLHKDEVNYKNNLGTQGRLVAAYAKLMKEMWIDSEGRTAPWDVKKSIGKVAQQFSGFAQQDSYELFNYLVDTLHEDLNRVVEKPYTEVSDSDYRPDSIVSQEHWKAFTDRNRSVIVDLMYGQLKSRLRCKVCDNESNTFDPFLALSLPIPKAKCTRVLVVFIPKGLKDNEGKKEFRVDITSIDTGKTLNEKILAHLGLDSGLKLQLNKMNKYGNIQETITRKEKSYSFEDSIIIASEIEEVSEE